jgi:hypothetical protein
VSTLFRDFMEKDSLREIAGGDVAALGRSVDKLNDMITSAHQTSAQIGPVRLPDPHGFGVDVSGESLSHRLDNSKEAAK